MRFESTTLQGVYLLHPEVYGDERGFFTETWNEQTFKEAGFDWRFVQDNHSRSAGGTLRGMHFQTTQTQGKLVRVTSGEIFDAVVDLRRSSTTFGQWFGAHLSADNKQMMYVPPGFAHGFYVISEYADFLYKCTNYYHPQSEVSLRWNDPEVGIQWPLRNDGEAPTLSSKDEAGSSWSELPYFQ